MKNLKVLITVIFFVNIAIPVWAQKTLTPDRLVKRDGRSFNCRILLIDSVNIEFIIIKREMEVRTYAPLNGVASYTFQGKEVQLRPVDWADEVKSVVEETKPLVIKETKPIEWNRKKVSNYLGENLPRSVVRLSFMVPSLQIEGKISLNSTFVASIWSGISYSSVTTNNSETESSLKFYPNLSFGPRFYTTLERRVVEGKRIDYYSGSYVAVPISVSVYENIGAVTLATMVGFQRTIGNKGFWNIAFGFGVSKYRDLISIGPVGEIGLGIILSK
jgi:hypothetical protein